MVKTITEKELDLIFPEDEVTIGGHVFTIRPFSFAETRVVATKLKKVLHLFAADNLDANAFGQIYGDAYEGIRDVIAMTLNINKNLVDRFDVASAFRAITHIIKINKDFFSESVGPEIEELAAMFGMNDKEEAEQPEN